jgi:hypothetical protein
MFGGSGGPGRAKRVVPIGLALIVALSAAGCELLYGYDPTDDDAFAPPKSIATYREGEATITIADEPAIALETLTSGELLDGWYGGEATWSNASGWYVRIMGAGVDGGLFGSGATLMLDRIVDNGHWTVLDPSRCIVTIEAADAKSLRGSATCKGLRWSDALGTGTGFIDPVYIDGVDPFDAEITFVARPTTTTPG